MKKISGRTLLFRSAVVDKFAGKQIPLQGSFFALRIGTITLLARVRRAANSAGRDAFVAHHRPMQALASSRHGLMQSHVLEKTAWAATSNPTAKGESSPSGVVWPHGRSRGEYSSFVWGLGSHAMMSIDLSISLACAARGCTVADQSLGGMSIQRSAEPARHQIGSEKIRWAERWANVVK